MNKDQIRENADALFKDAALPPKTLREQIEAHDARLDDERDDLSLAKMAAATKFWDWVDDASERSESTDTGITRFLDRIEVNRIKPSLTGHLAALFPRGMRAVVAATARTTGDTNLAQLVLNDFLRQARTRERMMLAGRQGLTYGAAGAKVGFDPAGDGRSPQERVWWRVFPKWQLLLDADVHDWEDQRFIGHIHHRPKAKVERMYGLENLAGTARDDFLSAKSTVTKTKTSGRAPSDTEKEALTDRMAFVRVAEVCNLMDTIEVNGRLVRGRLEVHILDQADLDLPVYIGPLPMSDETGKPTPHIRELIFDYEAEYPFRPVAYVRQLMPQQVELNIARSQTQQASRRDARVYLTRKGVLNGDDLARVTAGEDGAILQIDPATYDGPLNNVLVAVQHQPVSPNIRETGATAAADLERSIVQSPAALGIVTKATAEEVRAVESHTESEFGRHGEQRDIWLVELCKLYLRALADAMRSEAGHDAPAEVEIETPVAVASDGEEPAEPQEEAETDEAAEEPAETPTPEAEPEEPSEDEAAVRDGVEEAKPSAPPADAKPVEPVSMALVLLDENGAKVEVPVEAIDSAFDIGFTETGRTPLIDSEQRRNLIGLKDPYLALIAEALKGGATGEIALVYAKAIATKFDFPNDLHPDALLKRAREAEEARPRQPPNNGAGDPEKGLAALAAMAPDEALAELERVAGNDPNLGPLIAKAKALPPEARGEAVQTILGAMSPGAQG